MDELFRMNKPAATTTNNKEINLNDQDEEDDPFSPDNSKNARASEINGKSPTDNDKRTPTTIDIQAPPPPSVATQKSSESNSTSAADLADMSASLQKQVTHFLILLKTSK
jgi:hypothetical protein